MKETKSSIITITVDGHSTQVEMQHISLERLTLAMKRLIEVTAKQLECTPLDLTQRTAEYFEMMEKVEAGANPIEVLFDSIRSRFSGDDEVDEDREDCDCPICRFTRSLENGERPTDSDFKSLMEELFQ